MRDSALHRRALRFLRGKGRVLLRLTAWSVLETGQTFVTGYAVARAVDDGFLAGDARTGLAWLATAALAVILGAYGTGRAYRAVGALVEPLRDALVERVVARAVATADRGAVSRLTQQVEIARDSFAGLLMVCRSFVFTAAGALIGLASLAAPLVLLVAPPLLAAIALFTLTLRLLARRQEAFLVTDERLAAQLATVTPGLRDVSATGAERPTGAALTRLSDAEFRAARALARWSVVRVLALTIGGRLPVALLLVATPWLLRHGVTAGALLGALTYITQSLLPALQSLMDALGTSGSRLLVVLRRLAPSGTGGSGEAVEEPRAGLGAESPRVGLGAEPGSGLGAEPGSGLGAEPGPGLGAESRVGLGAEPGSGLGAEPGSGLGAEPGSGLGAEPGSGLGAEPGPGLGAESRVGLGAEPGSGLGAESCAGRDTEPRPGRDTEPRPGRDTEPGRDVVLKPGADVAAESGAGVDAEFRKDVVVGPRAAAPVPAPVPAPAPAPAPGHALAPAVCLEDVTFAYGPGAEPVLRGLDLSVPQGAHLAVVGPSGIGKSTLAGIAAGLLRPQEGEAWLCGARADGPEALARRVLIPQEAYVFSGTVAENLSYLRQDTVPEAELLAAADAVGMGPLLERLGGLDALVEPAALSAGERQLIALTRAHLSRAPVALLDEATCHLDPEAEARAEGAFAERPGGTLVVIAHRISSARRADRILVMDGPRVVSGHHDELLERSGLYRDLIGAWAGTPLS
ncbi:ATP-binding cassette domain-containing protein [Streptomyces monticola]|uniref:ATP-binding cassette domain-containing protein n=1 Tax=Streptomyces monticola TaxID=2666263 RepID=A0ABW2JRW7_9ACTN